MPGKLKVVLARELDVERCCSVGICGWWIEEEVVEYVVCKTRYGGSSVRH